MFNSHCIQSLLKLPTQTLYAKCATRTIVDSIHLLFTDVANAKIICKCVRRFENTMGGVRQGLMPQYVWCLDTSQKAYLASGSTYGYIPCITLLLVKDHNCCWCQPSLVSLSCHNFFLRILHLPGARSFVEATLSPAILEIPKSILIGYSIRTLKKEPQGEY